MELDRVVETSSRRIERPAVLRARQRAARGSPAGPWLVKLAAQGRALGALADGRRCSRRGPELPGLVQVLDEIEGIGSERCSAGIEPEHRRALTDGPELAQGLDDGRRFEPFPGSRAR